MDQNVLTSSTPNFAGLYTTGNLGIGTTNPGAKLVVAYGAGTTEANIKANVANNLLNLTSNYTAGADYAPGISFSSADNNATISKAGIYSRFTGSGSYLMFGTSGSYATGVTNNAMVIDYSGNVGIGTASPRDNLEISGYLRFGGYTGSGTTPAPSDCDVATESGRVAFLGNGAGAAITCICDDNPVGWVCK